jgi:hypothetical protein
LASLTPLNLSPFKKEEPATASAAAFATATTSKPIAFPCFKNSAWPINAPKIAEVIELPPLRIFLEKAAMTEADSKTVKSLTQLA